MRQERMRMGCMSRRLAGATMEDGGELRSNPCRKRRTGLDEGGTLVHEGGRQANGADDDLASGDGWRDHQTKS